jgi:pimeloyl-ACP methyl ester carboxylesterase
MSATGPPTFVSYDSILLQHEGPVSGAYLLLHGLTASPLQFAEFGELLHARGANVYIPRLPHHGLSDRLTSDLQHLTADELRSFAADSVAFARTLGERLTVVGFSVGGLVAAYIAQHIAVERVTCIAPFLGVAWIPGRLTARAARLALGLPNRFLWWDPILRERQMPAHGYPRFATHAVAQAAALAADVFEEARRSPPAAGDIQIVLNASESTVSNRAGRRLAALWSARKGGRIVLHRLSGLPLSHDIIEPLAAPGLTSRVYPALLDLVAR